MHALDQLPDADEGKIESIFDKATASKFAITDLPVLEKTTVMIVTANGILRNGGFEYFFESDFPDGILHKDFIEAYETIGSTIMASLISRALDLLQLYPDMTILERQRILARFKKGKGSDQLGSLNSEMFDASESDMRYLTKFIDSQERA